MWGTAADRLAYLREAKSLLRPLGKLIVVEPAQAFGGADRTPGVAKLARVLERLGMRLAEAWEYAVHEGSSLLAFVVDYSSALAAEDIDPSACDWAG